MYNFISYWCWYLFGYDWDWVSPFLWASLICWSKLILFLLQTKQYLHCCLSLVQCTSLKCLTPLCFCENSLWHIKHLHMFLFSLNAMYSSTWYPRTKKITLIQVLQIFKNGSSTNVWCKLFKTNRFKLHILCVFLFYGDYRKILFICIETYITNNCVNAKIFIPIT